MKKMTVHFILRTILLFLSITLQTNTGFTQTYQKLFDFDGANGSQAFGKIISDGTYFYGMTRVGGSSNHGVIYKIKTDGTGFVKLHDFDSINGSKPYHSLTLVGTELFGMTLEGGTGNQGVLFKIQTDGTNFTKILDVVSQQGQFPHSSLYYDGTYLYGSTYGGGLLAGGGMLYKIKPDGTNFAIVHSFNGSDNIDGTSPLGDLLFDGVYFYGSLYNGGAKDMGVLYKIKPDGSSFQKLFDFDSTNVEPSWCAGSQGLLLHSGFLYGTTFQGGTNGYGFVYKIDTDGNNFSVLHNFDLSTGARPNCELIIAGDYLYGTTSNGGPTGGGVIFRIKPDGTGYNNMYDFNTSSGYSPYCGLLYDNYSLFGVNVGGGDNNNNGTIFRFNDDNVTSVPALTNNNSLHLFPNPATSFLNIQLEEDTHIRIVDILGKTMLTQQLTKGNNTIDVRFLASGTYVLQTEDGGKVKFIKE